MLAVVPRAAEVLARLGITLGPDAGCLRAALCGNEEEDEDEECDDGADNSDTDADACRSDCTEPYCGDGVVDSDEDCDDGNTRDGDGCESDCSASEGECGNGVLEGDEDCDDGNAVDGDGCDSDCTTSLPECGDGVRDEDEECDQGSQNSDRVPGRCRTDCSAPSCDDGVVDVDRGEECEPPGTVLCSDECRLRLTPELPARAPDAASSGPIGCQAALMSAAGRLFDRTRAATAGCVAATARCVLDVEERDADGTRTDRCLAAANRRCGAVLGARSRLAARALGRLDAACGGVTLGTLLDAARGLGFARVAAECPIAAGATPAVGDLLACVASTVQCRADDAVARTVPRAYELLGELDLDPDADFPCVADPDELASD
jgi:cysteine-rich repeat protein